MRNYLVQLVNAFEELSVELRESDIMSIVDSATSTIEVDEKTEKANQEHYCRIVNYRQIADSAYMFAQLRDVLGLPEIVEWLQNEGHVISFPSACTRAEYAEVIKRVINLAATDSRVRDYLRTIPVYPTLEEEEG